jgi:hypothetical protein
MSRQLDIVHRGARHTVMAMAVYVWHVYGYGSCRSRTVSNVLKSHTVRTAVNMAQNGRIWAYSSIGMVLRMHILSLF